MSSRVEESSAAKKSGLMWLCIHLKASVALPEAAGRFNLLQALLPTRISHRNSWPTPQLSTGELDPGCLEAVIFLLGRAENLNSHQTRNVIISLVWWLFKGEVIKGSSTCLGQADSCVPAKLGEGLLFRCTLLTQRHCPVSRLTENILVTCYPLKS